MDTKQKSAAEPAKKGIFVRWCDIGLRTAHIAVICVLVGGHFFNASAKSLHPWLVATIVTGAGLVIVEAYPGWRWCLEARGWMVIAKVLLVALVSWAWNYRIAILACVIVIGSVGSHMPGKWRHFPGH